MSAPGVLRGIATRPAKRAAMISHPAAAVDANSGIAGDYGRRRGRSQVTVLSEEAWREACDAVGTALPWTARRANLFVAGIPLKPLAGSRIVIGDVVLEVTGETDPCRRMDEAKEGLRRALTPMGRGGVRCRIVSGGSVSVGDVVIWRPAMADLFAVPETRRAAR